MFFHRNIWCVGLALFTAIGSAQEVYKILPLAEGGALIAEQRDDGDWGVALTRLDPAGTRRVLAQLEGEFQDAAAQGEAAIVIVERAAHRLDLESGQIEKLNMPEVWGCVAGQRTGFLLGGYEDKIMASADGRTWQAQDFKAPGTGEITALNAEGPQAIALRTVAREENGWNIISSEICVRDPATGAWRMVRSLDGGNRNAPLARLDWVDGRWLARGEGMIVSLPPGGAAEVIYPEVTDGRYGTLAGTEPIQRTGERWRIAFFEGELESKDLKSWQMPREFRGDFLRGAWFFDSGGDLRFYGVAKPNAPRAVFSPAALLAALAKPEPKPVAQVAAQIPPPAVKVVEAAKPAVTAKSAAPVIPDAALVAPRTPEPRTATEFFERGQKRLKNYQHREAAADFRRAMELGEAGGALNLGMLYQSGGATGEPEPLQGLFWWEHGAQMGHRQAVEDLRPNADWDRGKKLAQQRDWVGARQAWETAAAAGHGLAQNALAEMYLHGIAVAPNLEKAKGFFEEAEETGQSSWAKRRLKAIDQGDTLLQQVEENTDLARQGARLGARLTGAFTPLPAATVEPTQAQIDATIKRSPWTYTEIAAALEKGTNHGALAAAIRVDGGDFYDSELAKIRALPQLKGAADDYGSLTMALIDAEKAGAGPWARAAAAQAIAARRAQLPAAPEAWVDSLALRRRAAGGELAALYQLSRLRAEELTVGGLPELITKQFNDLAERAVRENYAPALWLAGEKLEYERDDAKVDYAQAAAYYRASAQAGEAEGAWRLAKLYHDSGHYKTKQQGVAKNYLESERWYGDAGALARPGQTVGYLSPEDSLYFLYSFNLPAGSKPFPMQPGEPSLRWARELIRRGGLWAENAKAKLEEMCLEYNTGDPWAKLTELPPEVAALSAAETTTLEQAATAGDAAAALKLGEARATGRGLEQDDIAANRWFERAAELGNATAMRRLEQQYARGHGVKIDPAAQARWLRRAAEAGDVTAWVPLGRQLKGDERVTVLQKAADAGDADGLYELADTYQYGRGDVPKDEAKFLDLAQRAARAGSIKAMDRLGFYYSYDKKDAGAAVPWYQMAVAAGDKASRMKLADLLKQTKDIGGAEKIYRELAEESDVVAQLKLAMLLDEQLREEEGIVWMRRVAASVPSEQQKAAAEMVRRYDLETNAAPGTRPWLERRARRGDNEARFELARMIIRTDKTAALTLLNAAVWEKHAPSTAMYYAIAIADPDKEWAPGWLARQVSEGNAQAIMIEGQLLAKTNPPEALKRIERAAGLGNLEAKFQLGMGKYQGQQVAQDRAGGIALIREAAEGGFPAAQFTLGKGLLKGDTGLAADPKRGLALLETAAEQNWQVPVALQALVLLGQVYESGQVPGIPRTLTKALENFDRAAKLDPGNAQLQQHLNVLRQQHSFEMKMGGKM